MFGHFLCVKQWFEFSLEGGGQGGGIILMDTID